MSRPSRHVPSSERQYSRTKPTVRKPTFGQKGVEVTVYGPKYWKGRKKTKDEYQETVVKGYHAGFVKVPREYLSHKQAGEQPQPRQEG